MFCANFIFQTHSSQKKLSTKPFYLYNDEPIISYMMILKDTFYFAVTIERCRFFCNTIFPVPMSPLWQFHKGRYLVSFKSIDPPLQQTIPAQVLAILMPFTKNIIGYYILYQIKNVPCHNAIGNIF